MVLITWHWYDVGFWISFLSVVMIVGLNMTLFADKEIVEVGVNDWYYDESMVG